MTDSQPAFLPLSNREKQCLTYLAQGMRLQELANKIGVSTKTAEKQITAARKKLGASTREHAVAIAVGNNLLGNDEGDM